METKFNLGDYSQQLKPDLGISEIVKEYRKKLSEDASKKTLKEGSKEKKDYATNQYAAAGIEAAATLGAGLMQQKAAMEEMKRQLEAEKQKQLAESAFKQSQMITEGSINPLRQLMASYRAAL